jgi:hypothetical protein
MATTELVRGPAIDRQCRVTPSLAYSASKASLLIVKLLILLGPTLYVALLALALLLIQFSHNS